MATKAKDTTDAVPASDEAEIKQQRSAASTKDRARSVRATRARAKATAEAAEAADLDDIRIDSARDTDEIQLLEMTLENAITAGDAEAAFEATRSLTTLRVHLGQDKRELNEAKLADVADTMEKLGLTEWEGSGEVIDLDELAEESTREDARDRAEAIRNGFNSMMDFHDQVFSLITEALEKRDYLALGYESFSAYVDTEFGIDRLPRLTREMRQTWALTLDSIGLGQAEIAAIAGVSQPTISGDLRRAADAAMTGLEDTAKLVLDTRPDGERQEIINPDNESDDTVAHVATGTCNARIPTGGAGRPPKCYLKAGHAGDHLPKPGKASARVQAASAPQFPKVRSVVENFRKSAKIVDNTIEKLAERRWAESSRLEAANLLADVATELHESADLMLGVAGELRSSPKGHPAKK